MHPFSVQSVAVSNDTAKREFQRERYIPTAVLKNGLFQCRIIERHFTHSCYACQIDEFAEIPLSGIVL